MQVIPAFHIFTFLHSCHCQVWIHCWKTSLFLPVTEMLSQQVKREVDVEEHFARILLVPRRNLGEGSALLGSYMMLWSSDCCRHREYVLIFYFVGGNTVE